MKMYSISPVVLALAFGGSLLLHSEVEVGQRLLQSCSMVSDPNKVFLHLFDVVEG